MVVFVNIEAWRLREHLGLPAGKAAYDQEEAFDMILPSEIVVRTYDAATVPEEDLVLMWEVFGLQ